MAERAVPPARRRRDGAGRPPLGPPRPFGSIDRPIPAFSQSPNSCSGHHDPAFRKEGRDEDRRRAPDTERGDEMTTPYIGLDIAKDHIDIGIWPDKRSWQVPNHTEGIASLVEEMAALSPACVVLEASGSYEQEAAATLASAGLPVVVVNPRQVRDFAKATGQL